MTDYSYHYLKNLITRNVKESYCILPIRYGGMETISIRKPETKYRWWHHPCKGNFRILKNLVQFPFDVLLNESELAKKFLDSDFMNITQSEKEVIDSLLYDTTGGRWYDSLESQTGRGGTTEFIFLKRNSDNSVSVTYLDNVADYIEFRNCVVARNLLLGIYDYFSINHIDCHTPEFIRVSKVPAPKEKVH